MKLLSDTKTNFQFEYKNGDMTETWYYGDYLKKLSYLLNDDDNEKIKLQTTINTIQNTEWPSVEIYDRRLNSFASELDNHINTHKDPFLL